MQRRYFCYSRYLVCTCTGTSSVTVYVLCSDTAKGSRPRGTWFERLRASARRAPSALGRSLFRLRSRLSIGSSSSITSARTKDNRDEGDARGAKDENEAAVYEQHPPRPLRDAPVSCILRAGGAQPCLECAEQVRPHKAAQIPKRVDQRDGGGLEGRGLALVVQRPKGPRLRAGDGTGEANEHEGDGGVMLVVGLRRAGARGSSEHRETSEQPAERGGQRADAQGPHASRPPPVRRG